jgi:hypothetical protein
MADASERHRGLGIPFLPLRLCIPNPLAWVPRPRLLGKLRKRRLVASTTIDSLASTSTFNDPPLSSSRGSKVQLKPASDVFAGAVARAASQSTIHPLDTLKVRLQTNRVKAGHPPAGLSKIGQLVPPSAVGAPPPFDLKVFGNQMASLYKGVFGAASGAGIAIGAYFACYGVACNLLSTKTELPPSSIAFAAGGMAALGSSFVKVPLAVCIRSVQAGIYPNVFNAAQSIVKAVGPRGLFTGYLPTVLEDVPDMAVKFATYETMRQMHQKLFPGRPASVQEDFAMGAFSGALAAAATTPLDVIKTNMMCTAAVRPSMRGAAAQVLAQGGPKAFFRGVGTRALSNGINSAVFFCFFEAIRTSISEQKQREQHRAMQLQELEESTSS